MNTHCNLTIDDNECYAYVILVYTTKWLRVLCNAKIFFHIALLFSTWRAQLHNAFQFDNPISRIAFDWLKNNLTLSLQCAKPRNPFGYAWHAANWTAVVTSKLMRWSITRPTSERILFVWNAKNIQYFGKISTLGQKCFERHINYRF